MPFLLVLHILEEFSDVPHSTLGWEAETGGCVLYINLKH